MKQILTTALLVFASSVLTTSQAVAALAYVNGDLFMGFHATGGQGNTQTYVVNIGQASVYRDVAADGSVQPNLGNIGADLAFIFGANWYNRSDLFWGVVGGNTPAAGTDPNNTLYASRAQSPFGTPAVPWARRSNSQQGATFSTIQGLIGAYQLDDPTSNSNFAAIQNTSDPNNWDGFNPPTLTTSFGVWNPSIEDNFDGGPNGTALDLFRLQTSSTAGVSGTYEGTFTIGTDGAVTFTNVPEPASAALLGLSACLLGLVRRRQQPVNA